MSKRTMIFALFSSLAVAAVVAGAARAADIPVKATPAAAVSYAYPTTKCGMYYGVNTLGQTAAVENSTVGTQFVQGAIGLTLGYTCPMGSAGSYWFADGMFDFTNLNGSANGLSLSGPAKFEQRFGAGASIPLLISLVPSLSTLQNAVPSLIPLPTGVNVVTTNPYMFAGLHEDDIGGQVGLANFKQYLVSVGFGIGTKTRLSNGVVFDPFVEYIIPSSQVCVVASLGCFKKGPGVQAGMALEF